MESIIQIKNLTKRYKIDGRKFKALNNISLEIAEGSFTTIVGKSGCGKSTLLRVIAGLETAEGKITGREMIKSSLVFQEARLMPWLTVEENILFPLKNRELKSASRKKVKKHLDLLGLNEFKDAYPDQISGGMAQRTALGRALVYDSEIILMDEPLGSLDAFNRYKLQQELQNIFNENEKTVIFVTHDIDEAIFLGDRVLVMESGSITKEFSLEQQLDISNNNAEKLELKEKILAEIKA